jgi:hypothetical protein
MRHVGNLLGAGQIGAQGAGTAPADRRRDPRRRRRSRRKPDFRLALRGCRDLRRHPPHRPERCSDRDTAVAPGDHDRPDHGPSTASTSRGFFTDHAEVIRGDVLKVMDDGYTHRFGTALARQQRPGRRPGERRGHARFRTSRTLLPSRGHLRLRAPNADVAAVGHDLPTAMRSLYRLLRRVDWKDGIMRQLSDYRRLGGRSSCPSRSPRSSDASPSPNSAELRRSRAGACFMSTGGFPCTAARSCRHGRRPWRSRREVWGWACAPRAGSSPTSPSIRRYRTSWRTRRTSARGRGRVRSQYQPVQARDVPCRIGTTGRFAGVPRNYRPAAVIAMNPVYLREIARSSRSSESTRRWKRFEQSAAILTSTARPGRRRRRRARLVHAHR